MSSPSATNITLFFACHCKTFVHRVILPASSFPLKSSICHCTTCRHVSGTLVPTFAVIPLPHSSAPSTKGLKAWNKTSGLTRWFCEKCGASCWNDDRTGEEWEWEVPTGVIRDVLVDGKVVRKGMQELLNRVQLWVGDTRDGGGAVWVNAEQVEGMDRRVWGRESELACHEVLGSMIEEGKKVSRTGQEQQTGQKLKASCACGEVRLSITRDEKGGPFEAGLDACESCRLVSGFEITSWATVPVSCITMGDGSSLDLKRDIFGRYQTSPNVERYFCRRCGATIFYQQAGRDTLDVAAGLLDALEGTRAESWLTWTKYGNKQVAYMEDAIDKPFAAKLASGCQSTAL